MQLQHHHLPRSASSFPLECELDEEVKIAMVLEFCNSNLYYMHLYWMAGNPFKHTDGLPGVGKGTSSGWLWLNSTCTYFSVHILIIELRITNSDRTGKEDDGE